MLENSVPTVGPQTRNKALEVEARPRRRAKLSNKPFSKFSRNTAVGRRIADLASGFIEALGNPDDVTIISDCVAAAELKVIAEQARERAIRDRSLDADAIVRIEGVACRAVRRLGLDRKRQPAAPSLQQYLAEREAAKEGAL